MSNVIYSDCDISIHEKSKEILINPKGERFYFVPCDAQDGIYRNATLTLDEQGRYVIEGTQLLYTEHYASSFSYEKLLCEHPAELIRQQNFLGLIIWYSVKGIMKREVRARYVFKHAIYQIHERLEFLSHTCIAEV
jgi:hypothetical protein